MFLKPKLKQQGKLIAGVLLSFQAIFVLILLLALNQLDHVVAREQHSREMISTCGEISKELLSGWMKAAALLLGPVPGSLIDLSNLSSELPGSPRLTDKLASLSKKSSGEEKLSASIIRLLQKTRDFGRERLQRSEDSRTEWMDEDTILFVRLCSRLAEKINVLITYETKLLQHETADRLKFRSWIQFVLLGGAGLSTALSIFLVWRFNQNTTSRLETLIESTRRFAAGEPLPGALEGDDEFSELDRSFRTMSAKIDSTMAALQEEEQRVRAILHNMLVGVLITDHNGLIQEANPGAVRMLSLGAEELVGSAVTVFLPALSEGSLVEVVERHPGKLYQTELRSGRESVIEVEYVCSILESNAGPRIIFNLLDISERRAAERLKRDFVAMVSHELRSPLTAIHGLLSLVAEGSYGASEKLQNRARLAETSASRLIRLISDWLDAEKIERGRFDLNRQPCRLRELLEEAIDAVSELAGPRQISIVLLLPHTPEVRPTESCTPEPHTNSQPAPQTPGPHTDSQTPPQTPAPHTDSQPPPQTPAPHTDSQTPPQTPAPHTDSQPPPQTPEPHTDSQTPPQTPAPHTNSTATADWILEGDRDKLIQVIVNLLSNAIKFSPVGGEVVINATTDNTTCRISVSDQGPGVPLEHQDAIFDPYFQVPGRTVGGTGLGLPICRKIVEAHGGKIELVRRQSNAGATFVISLPQYAQPADPSLTPDSLPSS